jgi:hypothetical protein
MWKKHRQKRKQIDLKLKEINGLREKNPTYLYKITDLSTSAVIKPIWSYATELCGWATKSNIVIMQRFQSKILRAIKNAPRYVTNHTVRTDFNIPYVIVVIHKRINKHHNNLDAHPNPVLVPLLKPINTRRLTKCWPLDLNKAPDVTSLYEYPTTS